MPTRPAAKPLIPGRTIAQWIGVHPRTLARWVKDETLGFPKPVEINGRFYWNDWGVIDRWLASRQQVA